MQAPRWSRKGDGVRCQGLTAFGMLPYKGIAADVKNHLFTERLRQAMKTDVFYWHGYTEIMLDGGVAKGDVRIKHWVMQEISFEALGV